MRFHARAYAASAGGDFFDAGGVAYMEGHQHSWRPGAATSADSPGPLWGEKDFDVDGDADDSGTGAAGVMYLNKAAQPEGPARPRSVAASCSPSTSASRPRRSTSAAASRRRRRSSRIRSMPGAALLTTHGLRPRGKPRFKEPRVKPLQPARCPTGRPRHAGVLQLSDPGFAANESEATPMVLVTRTGGSHGSASVTLTTHGGTARAGRDFKQTQHDGALRRRGHVAAARRDPAARGPQAEPAETFTVELGHARCAGLGGAAPRLGHDRRRRPAAAAATSRRATFTIGGTVDGLRAPGSCSTDLGRSCRCRATGASRFPGTRAAGQSYEVSVRTQPHGPDQVCTVTHGAGTVSSANVTDIAVHCADAATPTGLDPTFGGDGRVSTPVGGGHGEAVVIQPDGGIVTAGWRSTAAGADFALTRHDARGNLDHSFGTDGIATTDLGGDDDEAYDAALLAGRRDRRRRPHRRRGRPEERLRRRPLRADGTPDTGFGSGGIVKTDFLGGGDQANAVAVQPDGKIVVAGFAAAPRHRHRLRARPLQRRRHARPELRHRRHRDHRPRHARPTTPARS